MVCMWVISVHFFFGDGVVMGRVVKIEIKGITDIVMCSKEVYIYM